MINATTETKPEIEDDGPEMEDIVDFINDNKLQMYVLLAHENPYRPKEVQQGLTHWSCKLLNREGQFIVIYFSKGTQVRRWRNPPQTGLTETIPVHVPHDKVGTPYDGPIPPFDDGDEQNKRTYMLCSQPEPPYLIEVLDVLAKDIWLVEQAGGFNRWANIVNSSVDSISTRRAFEVICQQRAEVQALLGEEPYHKLLYEIDRINPYKFVKENENDADADDEADDEADDSAEIVSPPEEKTT